MLVRKRTSEKRFLSFIKKPLFIAVFSFLLFIVFGAFLFAMPFSTKPGINFSFLDALFTSASAFCAVGFSGFAITELLTIQGKCILLIFIQLGGMGFWSLMFLCMHIFRKDSPARVRNFIRAARGEMEHTDTGKIISFIVCLFFLFELVGAVLLSIQFIPEFGWGKGIFYSVFHSVSAFCNSGFSLLEVTDVSSDAGSIQFIMSFLCVCGGLGFFVWEDLLLFYKRKSLQLHTIISIAGTIILLITGCVFLFLIEYIHAGGTGDVSVTLRRAWLISADTRTSGFFENWIPQLHDASKLICIIYMFIGGGAASTAGGVKLPNFILLFFSVSSDIRRKKETVIAGSRIDRNLLRKSFLFFILPFFGIFMISFIFVLFESQKLDAGQISYLDILFDTVSLFSSTGLYAKADNFLSERSRVLAIILMIAGRIGATSLFFIMVGNEKKKDRVVYAQTHIQLN